MHGVYVGPSVNNGKLHARTPCDYVNPVQLLHGKCCFRDILQTLMVTLLPALIIH